MTRYKVRCNFVHLDSETGSALWLLGYLFRDLFDNLGLVVLYFYQRSLFSPISGLWMCEMSIEQSREVHKKAE